MFSEKSSKVFGGTMLIAGTSIGAAMLAMPIMTGLFGFFGTIFIMGGCWLFMYWTSTLLVEACMQFDDGTSFITMARSTLGPVGAMITWVTFLLFFFKLYAVFKPTIPLPITIKSNLFSLIAATSLSFTS